MVHQQRPSDQNCSVCRAPGSHKVGEEDARRGGHNFTNWLCCLHFSGIMGPVAEQDCGIKSLGGRATGSSTARHEP